MKKRRIAAGSALAFIMLMGVVSMFSDMTHEGASSILGAYLSLAGASAAVIGFTSGLGEFVGYSLRLLSGILADKTKHYWTITIAGYVIDMAAIPALALVPKGGWILACMLIIIERAGKALKKPAKDTLVSFAASDVGAGKGFAIQEFLDQLGAFIGPVILYVTLLLKGTDDTFASYAFCFLILGAAGAATILLLFIAKKKFPNPEKFEPVREDEPPFRMNRTFRIYIAAISLFAMGFVDFNLISMHAAKMNLASASALPLVYALAMAVDAFSALFFGWLYDRVGMKALAFSTLIAAPFSLLVFAVSGKAAFYLGVILWGIGMGAEESILKSAVTSIVPKQNRSSGFGIFQTAFGIAWFLGSTLMGFLYDFSIPAMVAFSAACQIAAVPLYLICARKFPRA
jgi:MFS family permease